MSSIGGDLSPVPPRGQSVRNRLAAIVPRLPQRSPIQSRWLSLRDVVTILLSPQIRVAIPTQSDFGRSTVRFASLRTEIRELSRLPGARLWRGTRRAWPRLFFV